MFTPSQKYFFPCPDSHFPPFLGHTMRALHTDGRQRQPLEALTKDMTKIIINKKKKRIGKRDIGVKMREFGVKTRKL